MTALLALIRRKPRRTASLSRNDQAVIDQLAAAKARVLAQRGAA